jgi:hypothetical protein
MSAPPLMSDKENANRKQILLGANGHHPTRRLDDEGVVVKSTNNVASSAETKNEDPKHLCKASSSDRSSFSRDSPVPLSSQLVLRRGEALEELFGIPRRPFFMSSSSSSSSSSSGKGAPSSSNSHMMESYRELCESIVSGGEAAADDARAWKDVVDMATAATATAANDRSQQREGLVLRAGACAD